jgi:hypothetical protein
MQTAAKKGRKNAISELLNWKARAHWAGDLQKACKTRAFSRFLNYWTKNAFSSICS